MFGLLEASFWRTVTSRATRAKVTMTGVPERNLHLTGARRRALTILMDAPEGCTVEAMMAHGFSVEFLAELLRDGLVNDTVDLVPIGKRKMQVARLRITDKGRLAINF